MDEAIVTTYRNKGITYDNASLDDPAHPGQYREMPILGDLHTVLSAAPETRRIANILNRLVHGSASSFNRQTNVNLDNSYVVIDISELSGDLLTVGMYIGLDYMWDKAKEDLTRRKQIFIDEVWQSHRRIVQRFGGQLCIRGCQNHSRLRRRGSGLPRRI